MPDAIKAIGQVADAVGSVAKQAMQKDAQRNTADMKDAAKMQNLQDAIDHNRSSIQSENLDEIRRAVASPDAGAERV